jgi:hypothetical protein
VAEPAEMLSLCVRKSHRSEGRWMTAGSLGPKRAVRRIPIELGPLK